MVEIRPQPAQVPFLANRADIAIYGGSAGGGKTWSLLVDPLRHIRNPRFRGVIFRRTYPEITVEGGLWDESATLYPLVNARPIKGDLEWRFPSGATVRFAHLQHDSNKYNWQGSQVPFFGFDELSHFTESAFTYLVFSRGRSDSGVRPYVRGTCNPDPGWLKTFLAPWVDREYSGPRAASGEIRWFVREKGEMTWVPEGTPDSISLTFVRASVYDNAILLQRNPGYLASLKALLPVERARLLDGDWDVRREGLVYPSFEGCIVDPLHAAAVLGQPASVGGIDFGFHNPFAANWGHLDGDDVLWIADGRYRRECTLPVHSEALPKGLRWQADPARPDSIAELRQAGHDVVPCVHRPVRGGAGAKRTPILAGVDMVTERMRTGRLRIVRNAGTMPLIRELGLYHYDPEKLSENPVDEDNHACDALRYMVVGIDRNRAVPSVATPETDADIEAREQAEAAAEAAEKVARQRKAELDYDAEEWWQS